MGAHSQDRHSLQETGDLKIKALTSATIQDILSGEFNAVVFSNYMVDFWFLSGAVPRLKQVPVTILTSQGQERHSDVCFCLPTLNWRINLAMAAGSGLVIAMGEGVWPRVNPQSYRKKMPSDDNIWTDMHIYFRCSRDRTCGGTIRRLRTNTERTTARQYSPSTTRGSEWRSSPPTSSRPT
jgi:hypothetical protein